MKRMGGLFFLARTRNGEESMSTPLFSGRSHDQEEDMIAGRILEIAGVVLYVLLLIGLSGWTLLMLFLGMSK
jgi:hypothetical protein